MINALHTLPREAQKRLIGTRVGVLLELPAEARSVLLGTDARVLSAMPEEVQTAELAILRELIGEMPPALQAVVNQKMGDTLMPMLHPFHARRGRTESWCPGCQISG